MNSDCPSRLGVFSKWRSHAGTVMLRTWMTFSVLAFVLAVAFSIFDHDSLLKSDDPYIVAGIVAGFCSGSALVYGVVRALGGSPLRQLIAYLGTLLGLSLFFIVLDLASPGGEGHGIPTFFGTLIAITGTVAYPIQRIPLTKLPVVLASIPGLLYAIGYICAAIVMSSRGF